MTKRTELSLRACSVSSVVWYLTVVGGWLLVALALVELGSAGSIALPGALAMMAALVLVLELLPLVQGGGHDPQGVVTSTAFVCAILFVWGPWPAIAILAAASLVSDLRVGKQWWKVVFNPAQYSLSLGAAYLAMILFHQGGSSLARPLADFNLSDTTWVLVAWVVYFTVNLGLVAGVMAWSSSFRAVFTDDFAHYSVMTFAVLALSPVVVVICLDYWPLLPLLVVPLLLLYYTARMAVEREYAAGHDALTGLPNRSTLQFVLDEAIAELDHDSDSIGLMVIDLNDFKRVNDTLGHQVGDSLLVSVARRLRNAVRESDHVARLGGDEFAVVVLDADPMEILAVAERIGDALGAPIGLAELTLEVGVSIGVAICPIHGADGATLLRRADVAMYLAKDTHSVIEVYSPDRDDNSADGLSLLGQLRQALDDDQLELFYQPKVSTADGTPIGVEALLRWNHPSLGYIPPDQFIALAEGSGIMALLTQRVLNLALAQAASWRDQGLDVPVAVNVTPGDLGDDRLVRVISDGLRHHRLPARMLKLEITERIIADRLADSQHTLHTLRGMGVAISLDDFGTGYSSLLRLSALPVDEIKIDRGFISRLADGPQAVGIVAALIDLAHALGIIAIAEGVELQAEWDQLRALGCDGVQGWYVARPMPCGEATAWLRAHRAARARAHPI